MENKYMRNTVIDGVKDPMLARLVPDERAGDRRQSGERRTIPCFIDNDRRKGDRRLGPRRSDDVNDQIQKM